MSQADQLEIPAPAMGDSKSFEVLRVWIAEKGLHVALKAGVWNDPFAYGIMLSDLMKHIAIAYQQDQGLDPAIVLQRIKQGLDAELAMPTDEPTGSLQKP